jgi:hypothetical protein
MVETERPLLGQKYGRGDQNIFIFYLINRINENAFDALSSFPIDVHVLITKDQGMKVPSSLSDLENIAWACLYFA